MQEELIAVFYSEGFLIDTEPVKKTDFYYNPKLLQNFKIDPYKALFKFGFESKNSNMSQSLAFLHRISRLFIKNLSQDTEIEFTRSAKEPDMEELFHLMRSIPFANGIEFVNLHWIKSVWYKLSETFASEIAEYTDSVAEFLKSHDEKINVMGRVFFHLVENKSEQYPFAFLATYSTGSIDEKKASHVPLKNALIEYKHNHDMLLKLLTTVSKASDNSEFISELSESGELFSPLKFTADEAYTFLREIPIYEQSGIMCRIPNWWKNRSSIAKLSVSVGQKQPSAVGLDAILQFDPEIYFGEDSLTKEEVQQLLEQSAGLAFLKGKWIEVDHDKLKSVLEAYEKASAVGDITLMEAMRLELGLSQLTGDQDSEILEIKNGQWLKSLRSRLLNPSEIEDIKAGTDFKAALRNYQQVGLNWLMAMKTSGFGALLADDMGLGKTIQILALLDHLRANNAKALLIVPASLIGNWKNEIEKFAPKLQYKVIHGKNNSFEPTEADVFITTYGMSLRCEALKEFCWDLLILDEAQAIKNPNIKQTKSIKQLKSAFKIAMTGTPIENKIFDLWSIFDFLNAGFLGSSKEFSSFAKQMQASDSYSKLREMISPFVLRRLKTDKSIINDLPDKIEMKAFSELTKKQVVLYNTLVKELEHKLQDVDGIERKGAVLAAITKFKQICNHPSQYLGQASFEYEHSGKFGKLKEICEVIYEKRERVLVFTQFKEMTDPIAKFLETIFNRKGLVLHGGTTVKKRTEFVEIFNAMEYVPFMVLSLKAGGVGLNLTSANHVIHFDRWWNPAIENQATDRAFRIGQKKNVVVHKFVATGTIEEKIDSMIEEKQKVAGDILSGTGEKWITEMSNEELLNLVSLK